MRLRLYLSLLIGVGFGCGGSQPKAELQVEEMPKSAEVSQNSEEVAPEPPTVEPEKPKMIRAPVLSDSEVNQILTEARQQVVNGDFRGAERTFERVLVNDAEGNLLYFARYNLGVLCERRAAYQEAMLHFDKARGANPKAGAAILAMGRLYARQGQSAAGIELARQALKANPDTSSLQNALNRLLVDNNRELDAVIKSSKSILRKEENNAHAMLNMALAYQLKKRHAIAEAILRAAKKEFDALGEPRPDLLRAKALTEIALERKDDAVDTLQLAVSSPETDTAELRNLLGTARLELGSFEAAEAHFRKALEYTPNMVAACVNLSHAIKAQLRYNEALSTMNRCADMGGDEITMLYNLGILYLDGNFEKVDKLKKLKRAKSYFEEFLQKSKEEKWRKLATQYLKDCNGKIDDAVQEALELEEDRKAMEAEKAAEAAEAAAAADGENGESSPTADDNVDDGGDLENGGDDSDTGEFNDDE